MARLLQNSIGACLLFLLWRQCMYAQIIVNYNQPEYNKWHSEDMWNLTITNTKVVDLFAEKDDKNLN